MCTCDRLMTSSVRQGRPTDDGSDYPTCEKGLTTATAVPFYPETHSGGAQHQTGFEALRVKNEMLRFWMGGTGSASVDGLVPGLFRVPRDVRVHWQSQCHPTVTFQSERYHAQEPFGASPRCCVSLRWPAPGLITRTCLGRLRCRFSGSRPFRLQKSEKEQSIRSTGRSSYLREMLDSTSHARYAAKTTTLSDLLLFRRESSRVRTDNPRNRATVGGPWLTISPEIINNVTREHFCHARQRHFRDCDPV